MIEEKCIFLDSKDRTGRALKAMQVTEAKRSQSWQVHTGSILHVLPQQLLNKGNS